MIQVLKVGLKKVYHELSFWFVIWPSAY